MRRVPRPKLQKGVDEDLWKSSLLICRLGDCKEFCGSKYEKFKNLTNLDVIDDDCLIEYLYQDSNYLY